MSKRFTETTKWQDGWFLQLDNCSRMVWLYILDTCTNAGRWKSNFKLLNFCCNTDFDKKKFEDTFNGRVIYFLKDDFYFIPKFLKYQHPQGLNSFQPAVISIREELKQYNLTQTVAKLFNNSYLTVKDKDKDIDKDKDKDKDKNPHIKVFIDYAYSTCKEKKGFNLHIDGGKDGITIKRLLATHDFETLKKLWDKMLASEDEFILKAGISIGVFKSQINKLISQKEKKDWRM